MFRPIRTVWPIRALILAAGLTVGCGRRELARQTWPAMGTVAGVTVPGRAENHLPAYAELARETVREMEGRLSQFNPDGVISMLNRQAGGDSVVLDPDTLHVLALSLHYARVSRGAFDPTASPLVRLWGFHGGAPRATPPTPAEIRDALSTAGYSHVVLNEETREARLALPGMKVDLGGIAKGYAVDAVSAKLKAMGATDFMVNLAGDMRCFGEPSKGKPWRIGVRNPFNTAEIVGVLHLTDGWAVSTSGHYERFVEIEGTRYAHILDPRTGYPVAGMAGVTVVATNATLSDALSTALFVLGPDQALSVLRETEGCDALFIPDRLPLELWITPELQRRFVPDRDWVDAVRVLDL